MPFWGHPKHVPDRRWHLGQLLLLLFACVVDRQTWQCLADVEPTVASARVYISYAILICCVALAPKSRNRCCSYCEDAG